MSPQHIIERKRYISFPVAAARPSAARRLVRHLYGLAMFPFVFVAARLQRGPGLKIRWRCIGLGLRALARGDVKHAGLLVSNPMDSFRYFEFDFVLSAVDGLALQNYLDVSSPRLVPLMILDRRPSLMADVLNPVASDLKETATLAHSLGLAARCRVNSQLIEDVTYPEQSFDLITSVSVIEHIPDDTAAIVKMWNLLRPGGRLVMSVPCARVACEEFASLDEYQLLPKDHDGFVYWQRYYDEAALSQRIWSVTGVPKTRRIYGEVSPGTYDENVVQKRTNRHYPYWLEPLMMARDYRPFKSFDDLPGMGVVAMEFVKPLA